MVYIPLSCFFQVSSHAQKRFKKDMKELAPPTQIEQVKKSVEMPPECRPAACVFFWNAVNIGKRHVRNDSSKT